MRGSLLYMAPELFKAQFPTYAADVWSLAVCVTELTLMKHPFDGLNEVTVVEKILTRKIQKFPITRAKAIRDFVSSALNLDPKARPTAKSLAVKLGQRIGIAGSPKNSAATTGQVSETTTPRK